MLLAATNVSVSVFFWYTFQLKETHTHTTSLASTTYNLLTSVGFSCEPSATGTTKTRPTSFIKPKGKTQLLRFSSIRSSDSIILIPSLLRLYSQHTQFTCTTFHLLRVLPLLLLRHSLFQSMCRTFSVFFPFHHRFMRHGWMIFVLSPKLRQPPDAMPCHPGLEWTPSYNHLCCFFFAVVVLMLQWVRPFTDLCSPPSLL